MRIKIILAVLLFPLLILGGLFGYYWVHYSRIIDKKLKAGPFAETAMLFAAPEPINVGDPLTFDELERSLQRRGYSTRRSDKAGWYHMRADGVEVFPGQDAYPGCEEGVVFIKDNSVARIIGTADNTERTSYLLEPELITNLFDRNREKRRIVRFKEIPPVMVQAVISAEDKRFFEHAGFDPLRIVATLWVDVTKNRRYGASTITMQLARSFWLTQEKTWKRKAAEAMITLQLEQKLTKEQIFEYYANQVDLGRRRSFAVHGFGEASQVYFGKDLRDIKVEEAALLAGLIQRPNYLNPYRHPERATQRRNIVLGLMKENGYITAAQHVQSAAAPVQLAEGGAESTDAPYFVDLVYDSLQDRFADIDFQTNNYRVYTTLDLKLQKDAVAAVEVGMKEVDALLAKRKKPYPEAQVAMVVMDPVTAEVKALIGGRNYGISQLNRAIAKRQPGSIFKPFVYASALALGLQNSDGSVTPVSTVADEPTTFWFDGKPYEPSNFHQQFNGSVTLRRALAKSLNIPTVKFAEMAGFSDVAELARNAGLEGVRGTPSVALGSYEVTPLDMASAYTVFSNNGVWVERSLVHEIRSQSGGLVWEHTPARREVLDPRVAYMVTDLMQEVLRSGTGAGARGRGFTLPAAGKTGTSHDAWFAGFTSKLLCVVWVGFDDNQELPLEGAKAALPIWTEFMKRAHQYREYRAVRTFEPPDGIVTTHICPITGKLATSTCPNAYAEVFLAGTQPSDLCHLHGGGSRTLVAGWDSEEPQKTAQAAAADRPSRPSSRRVESQVLVSEAPSEATQPKKEKKGFFGRIRDIFK